MESKPLYRNTFHFQPDETLINCATVYDIFMNPYQISLPRVDETEDLTIYKPRDYLYALHSRKGVPVTVYVLIGASKAMVIDAGQAVSNLREAINKVTDKPCMLVLTHGHRDHIGGLNEFDEVYMHEGDKTMLANYGGTIHFLSPGDRIDLGELDVEVIDMIGHTPGSIGFLDHTHKLLFPGDAIGAKLCWMHITPLPLESLLGVLMNLEDIKEQWNEIWPAHFDQSDRILGMEYVRDLKEICEKIIRGEDVVTTEDKQSQDRFHLPFTPLIAENRTSGVIFNPEKKHFV